MRFVGRSKAEGEIYLSLFENDTKIYMDNFT